MKLLLSIKPEYVTKIFAGTKRFEYRRAIHLDRTVSTVAVYATRPVGLIVGEFDVAEILSMPPADLWDATHEHGGVERTFFDEYFAGRAVGFAMRVGAIRPFDPPLEPGKLISSFTPPQSYMYVSDHLGRIVGDSRQLALL
jgi:predicted transcriptional regulator